MSFAMTEILYLGHLISKKGIRPDPAKIESLLNCPTPTSFKQLRSFLGLASYYRRFFRNFASIVSPLYDLLKTSEFEWKDLHQRIFEEIKAYLISPPLLIHFKDDRPVIVHTDASGVGLGAVLVQVDESGKEQVVAYASRKLTADEAKCHSSETECLAVVWATRKFHPYLHGRLFTIFTDNIALRTLQSKTNLNAKLTRWALELQELTFEIKPRPGRANVDADFLSRLPE
jgi:hypothetical protein